MRWRARWEREDGARRGGGVGSERKWMAHGRWVYIVAYGPRRKGNSPGRPSMPSSFLLPAATSAAVYSGFIGMPSAVLRVKIETSFPFSSLAAAAVQLGGSGAADEQKRRKTRMGGDDDGIFARGRRRRDRGRGLAAWLACIDLYQNSSADGTPTSSRLSNTAAPAEQPSGPQKLVPPLAPNMHISRRSPVPRHARPARRHAEPTNKHGLQTDRQRDSRSSALLTPGAVRIN